MLKLIQTTLHRVQVIIRSVQAHDCPGLAAEMAFNMMLSFVPAIIFLFAFFGFIGREYDMFPKILHFIDQWVPPASFTLLLYTLKGILEGSSSGLALISFGVVYWTGSNGVAVVIKGISRAYGTPQQHDKFWYRRFMAMVVMVMLGGFIILGSNLLIVSDIVISNLEKILHFHWKSILLIHLSRWILIYMGITVFTSMLFATASALAGVKVRFTETLPGAILFVVLLTSISKGFTYYVLNLSHFNKIYGILGAVIVLMLWFYLSAFALLIGGEVNAYLHELKRNRKALEIPPAPPVNTTALN